VSTLPDLTVRFQGRWPKVYAIPFSTANVQTRRLRARVGTVPAGKEIARGHRVRAGSLTPPDEPVASGVCGRARGGTRRRSSGRSGPPPGGPSRRGRAIRADPRRGE